MPDGLARLLTVSLQLTDNGQAYPTFRVDIPLQVMQHGRQWMLQEGATTTTYESLGTLIASNVHRWVATRQAELTGTEDAYEQDYNDRMVTNNGSGETA